MTDSDIELRKWLTDIAKAVGELTNRIDQVWKDGQAYRAATLEAEHQCRTHMEHIQGELRVIRRSQRQARKRRVKEQEEAKKRSWFGWAGLLGMVLYRGLVVAVTSAFVLLGLLKPEHVVGILEGLEKLVKGG